MQPVSLVTVMKGPVAQVSNVSVEQLQVSVARLAKRGRPDLHVPLDAVLEVWPGVQIALIRLARRVVVEHFRRADLPIPDVKIGDAADERLRFAEASADAVLLLPDDERAIRFDQVASAQVGARVAQHAVDEYLVPPLSTRPRHANEMPVAVVEDDVRDDVAAVNVQHEPVVVGQREHIVRGFARVR